MKNLIICLIAITSMLSMEACSQDGVGKPEPTLRFVGSYATLIPEPSGLCLAADGQSLWTVSDYSNQIYRIDFEGRLLEKLSFVGKDLEGISRNSGRDGNLWVVEEAKNNLVGVGLDGQLIETRHLTIDGDGQSGLEGICALDSTGGMLVLNEKNPALIIELSSDFEIVETWTPIPEADYSGIAPANRAGEFWIVSDEARKLFLWKRGTGIVAEFPLEIKKAEGVAQAADGRIFIVSDSTARLYVYELEGM